MSLTESQGRDIDPFFFVKTLSALKVNNIIQNMESVLLRTEAGKEMYSPITHLERLDYVVHFQVSPISQEVASIFFINEKAIKETRL